MRHIDAIKIYQQKSCLIIDDMNEVRGSLKRMLVSFGIEVIDTAATSDQAMERCEQRQYDLVLCDYNLGAGQDGQQVLEALRFSGLLRNTSMFVMITAETSRDMVLGALEYLPDDYLTKPITQAMLQTRLTRIVLRHEDLYAIKEAIDNHDFERSIQLCRDKIEAGGKYSGSYKRIEAELLFRLDRFEEAQKIYEDSLRDSNPVWAQLGLGKTYLAQKKYIRAEQLLKDVVELDHRFVEAHDLLAQLYSEQGDYKNSLEATRDAVSVSPKSVLRQRRLANIAKLAEDRETRIKARRAALKVGEHSCYYSPQDYFDVVSDLLEENPDEDVDNRLRNARDARMYIDRAEKKHPQDKSVLMQTTAARSRLASFQNKTLEAAELLASAKNMQEAGQCNALAQLELAQAMADTGDKDGAASLIQQVARENPDNEDVADRVDALSEEPVSKKGRKIAADLTKRGIQHYEDKSFDAAIEVFERAIALFPNHVGLRLNIAQAALAKAKSGETQQSQQLCEEHLGAIGEISEDHKQFARYQHLLRETKNLFNQ